MRKSHIREEELKSSFCFRREERLKKRNEIREVFNKGKRISCHGVKLFVLKNEFPHNRICFTFSRNFGNAVERNRAKRHGREVYRNLKPNLQKGYDLILMVFQDEKKTGFAERAAKLQYLFLRAGLLK